MFHHLRRLSVATGTAVGAVVGAASATAIFIGTERWLSEGFNEEECFTRYKLDFPFRTVEKERRGLVAGRPDPLKGSSVKFSIDRPVFWTIDRKTKVDLEATVDIALPNAKLDRDYKEICDRLQMEGIQIKEKSEAEARRALTEYALFHLHNGVKRHSEKQCEEKCGLGVSHSAPNRPPDSLPSFFDSPPILSAQ